jgi:protocatechuate 3,4-dioxygenase beta subunit
LDDSMPRPVRNGIVVAEVMDLAEAEPVPPRWETYANINADGSFELRNLPPSGNLSLVVISEGFVSKDPTSYNRSARNPQRFKMTAPQPLMVRMEPTGSVRVKVLQPDGKPLAGAKVGVSPNQSFDGSSRLIGVGFNRADILKARLTGDDKFPEPEERFKFEAMTDANGKAVIRNLPSSIGQWLWVNSELYDMPIMSGGYNSPDRHASVQIVAGEETKLEIRMEPKGATSLGVAGENNQSLQRLPIREQSFSVQQRPGGFSGKIVDAQGLPLVGATVKIWSRIIGENKVRLAQSDANGEFAIKDTSQGVAGLLVTKGGFGPVYVFSQIMGKLEQPLVLDNTTWLRGPLKDANGKPFAGATVTAILQSGEDIQFSTRTDANGDFKLFLSPGQYDLSVKGDGVGGQGLRMKAQEFGEVSFVPAGAEALALEGVLA